MGILPKFLSMSNEITIPFPTDGLGPAMMALTDLQRKFVFAWFQFGGNGRKAAAAAGYTFANDNVLDVTTHRVFHSPKVQKAIREYAENNVMQNGVPMALNALFDIVNDPSHKDRAKVAQMLLDRTGFHAKTEHQMTVTHQDARETKILRVIQLAKAMGKDPRELLGMASDVIDADFTELDRLTDQSGREGLEDLL